MFQYIISCKYINKMLLPDDSENVKLRDAINQSLYSFFLQSVIYIYIYIYTTKNCKSNDVNDKLKQMIISMSVSDVILR